MALSHTKGGRMYNKNKRECFKLNMFDFMEVTLYCLCSAHCVVGLYKYFIMD